MKIESTDQDLRTMLTSGYYRIPRFQRPYSWDRENISDFWEDVIKGGSPDYFIGSMVVYKDGVQRFGVVDGQQRLTTITILLSVLRDAFTEADLPNLAAGVHGLIERNNIDNKPEFVVSTETSYPFFQDKIQKWGTPKLTLQLLDEESNLQSAQSQLRDLVHTTILSIKANPSFSDKRKAEAVQQRLISIRDALLNLKVILVKLDHEDDAYIIFETLNTRGKDLALADLVKNHFTKHIKASNSQSDEVKVKWGQLLEIIQGSSADLNTDAYLHHFWLSKYDYLPAKDLYKVMKKKITAASSAMFLDSLLADSKLYREMNEPTYGTWSNEEREIERSLTDLNTFRVTQQTPCVLSVLREYRDGKLKKKHVEEAVVSIEKFHFLFTAITSQRSSGGISAMYAALGRRLFEAPDTHQAYKVIIDLKQKLRDRIPSEAEFLALFPDVVYTDFFTKQRKLIKYILACFYRDENSASIINFSKMTIEHVRPQSTIKNADEAMIIGSVGNLLLVPEEINQKLKNKPFPEKRQLLLSSGVKLPKEMLLASDWGQKEIQERTMKLANEAYSSVWKI